MTIDHATCGHIDHITLDGSRHEEIHTAILGLIQKWAYAGKTETDQQIYNAAVQDLVDATKPFEVEQ